MMTGLTGNESEHAWNKTWWKLKVWITMLEMMQYQNCSYLVVFLPFSEFFYPLLGRTRFHGRCWEAIRLSHRLEPSGYAVHEEVDGLDIGGQHGPRLVLLRHTHRPQRRPYPICTGRSGNVRHRCGGGYAGPRFFLRRSFGVGACRCLELKCGDLWGCPTTPRSIDDLVVKRWIEIANVVPQCFLT